MGVGYLLGGIACVLYALLVGYFGGIKKSPGLIKIVKMKLGKMKDETAAKICLVMALIVLAVGIFLFIYGGVTA